MADGAGRDVGAFCRSVEEHLTRVNEGHLVRIVGPAFALVKGWADDGVPLSVVLHGIDRKAERHRHGVARRPLRIEFCDADVREAFATWRRAVGVAASEDSVGAPVEDASAIARRRPSVAAALDRIILRLGGLLGRVELAQTFRDRVNEIIAALVPVTGSARGRRGVDREAVAQALAPLDAALIAAARHAAGAELLAALARDAAVDLSAYRGRLAEDAWQPAVDATVDRLLRERWRLPTIDVS